MYSNEELVNLLTEIHIALDKNPLIGFCLGAKSWVKLSEITGIKWPREELTEEEIKQRRIALATNNNQS